MATKTTKATKMTKTAKTTKTTTRWRTLLEGVDWSTLEHVYGNAADVPELVDKTRATGKAKDKAWEDLWSALYHQGDANDAAAAAIPFLAALATDEDDDRARALACALELIRAASGGKKPPGHAAAVDELRAMTLAKLSAREPIENMSLVYLFSDLAMLRGNLRLAEALQNFDTTSADDDDDEEEEEEEEEDDEDNVVVATFKMPKTKGVLGLFLDDNGDVGGLTADGPVSIAAVGVKREKKFLYQVKPGQVLRLKRYD